MLAGGCRPPHPPLAARVWLPELAAPALLAWAGLGLAGALCPDHYFVSNVEECVQWGLAEGLDVLHYSEAEEFHPHADAVSLETLASDPDYFEKLGGQRLFSTMVYLNAVDAGGATAFPRLDLRIDPRPGRLLIFANTHPGNPAPNPLSLHAGEPVTEGEKWAAIAWWRQGPFRPEGLKGSVG